MSSKSQESKRQEASKNKDAAFFLLVLVSWLLISCFLLPDVNYIYIFAKKKTPWK